MKLFCQDFEILYAKFEQTLSAKNTTSYAATGQRVSEDDIVDAARNKNAQSSA